MIKLKPEFLRIRRKSIDDQDDQFIGFQGPEEQPLIEPEVTNITNNESLQQKQSKKDPSKRQSSIKGYKDCRFKKVVEPKQGKRPPVPKVQWNLDNIKPKKNQ